MSELGPTTPPADENSVRIDMLMAMLGAVLVLLFIYAALARQQLGIASRQRVESTFGSARIAEVGSTAMEDFRLTLKRPRLVVYISGDRSAPLTVLLRDPGGDEVARASEAQGFSGTRVSIALEQSVEEVPLTAVTFDFPLDDAPDFDGFTIEIRAEPIRIAESIVRDAFAALGVRPSVSPPTSINRIVDPSLLHELLSANESQRRHPDIGGLLYELGPATKIKTRANPSPIDGAWPLRIRVIALSERGVLYGQPVADEGALGGSVLVTLESQRAEEVPTETTIHPFSEGS